MQERARVDDLDPDYYTPPPGVDSAKLLDFASRSLAIVERRSAETRKFYQDLPASIKRKYPHECAGEDYCKGFLCYYNGPSWNPAQVEQELADYKAQGRNLWLYVTCPDHATRAPWNDPAKKYES